MLRIILLIILLSFNKYSFASDTVSLVFNRIDIPTLISIVYTEILDKNHTIHSDVLSQNELYVSLNLSLTKSQISSFMTDFLQSYDIDIQPHAGYLHFKPATTKTEIFTYSPLYRSPYELLPLLDYFSQDQNSQLSSHNQNLVFSSTPQKIQQFKTLLSQLDTPVKQVNVRAYIYEVSHSQNENSNALNLVFDLLSNRLNINLGSQRSSGNSLRLSVGSSFDLAFNALNNDSRFNVLSSPSLLVRHGETARFTVGTETPVLAGVTFTDSGQPVQNIEYRRSGVIFDLTPQINGENILLELAQQVSTFVNTTTGVATSPTLLTRELSTNLSLRDGDLMVMAGLRENRDNRDDIYLPFTRIRMGTENSNALSDIVLLLHCELVQDTPEQRGSRVIPSLPFMDMSSFLINLPGD